MDPRDDDNELEDFDHNRGSFAAMGDLYYREPTRLTEQIGAEPPNSTAPGQKLSEHDDIDRVTQFDIDQALEIEQNPSVLSVPRRMSGQGVRMGSMSSSSTSPKKMRKSAMKVKDGLDFHQFLLAQGQSITPKAEDISEELFN